MILTEPVSNVALTLPDDLRWTDEFDWLAVAQSIAYTLTGEIVIQQNTKQTGRTITLEPPDQEMAWVDRSTILQLYAWANLPNLVLTLQLQYPTDTRSFRVMFDQNNQKPVDAKPVRPWSAMNVGEEWQVTLRFIEVAV